MWPRRRARRREVIVYTRQGCHLCAQAEAVERRVARGHDVRLVDIDADVALTERYTVRVPVVTVDGTEVAEFQVDPAALRAALR
jgi:glutaredoxin